MFAIFRGVRSHAFLIDLNVVDALTRERTQEGEATKTNLNDAASDASERP